MSRVLASVNIFVESSEKDHVIAALACLQNIEEVYEVAGEYDIVSVVSASCLEEFRDVLHKGYNENQRRKKHHNYRNHGVT